MLSEGVPGLEGPEGEGGVFLVSLRSQRVWLEKVETCEKIFDCSLVNLYLPVSFFPYYFGPASPRSYISFSYFDGWINENLRHLMEQGLKIFDGNQNRSALGFMKYITRTNFNSTMKGFISVKRLT